MFCCLAVSQTRPVEGVVDGHSDHVLLGVVEEVANLQQEDEASLGHVAGHLGLEGQVAPGVGDQGLPVDPDSGRVVHRAEPEQLRTDGHHGSLSPENDPLVPPGRTDVEGAVVPGPAHEVPQAGVHGDVVVAGWDGHGQGVSEGPGEPGVPEAEVGVL